MKRNFVNSTNIRSIGYDIDESTLEIEFNNGRIYQYFGVTRSVYTDLQSTISKGRYFHLYIRGKFPYQRIM